jgi:hypothetical protein
MSEITGLFELLEVLPVLRVLPFWSRLFQKYVGIMAHAWGRNEMACARKVGKLSLFACVEQNKVK